MITRREMSFKANGCVFFSFDCEYLHDSFIIIYLKFKQKKKLIYTFLYKWKHFCTVPCLIEAPHCSRSLPPGVSSPSFPTFCLLSLGTKHPNSLDPIYCLLNPDLLMNVKKTPPQRSVSEKVRNVLPQTKSSEIREGGLVAAVNILRTRNSEGLQSSRFVRPDTRGGLTGECEKKVLEVNLRLHRSQTLTER